MEKAFSLATSDGTQCSSGNTMDWSSMSDEERKKRMLEVLGPGSFERIQRGESGVDRQDVLARCQPSHRSDDLFEVLVSGIAACARAAVGNGGSMCVAGMSAFVRCLYIGVHGSFPDADDKRHLDALIRIFNSAVTEFRNQAMEQGHPQYVEVAGPPPDDFLSAVALRLVSGQNWQLEIIHTPQQPDKWHWRLTFV